MNEGLNHLVFSAGVNVMYKVLCHMLTPLKIAASIASVEGKGDKQDI